MVTFQTVINSIRGVTYLYEGGSLDEAVRVAKTTPCHKHDLIEVWVDEDSEHNGIMWNDEGAVADLAELLGIAMVPSPPLT